MPTAIWTGAVSFGLVQVPVRLVTATRDRDLRFNQLEAGSGSRIRYRKVSEQTGEEVPPERIQRGFEVSKGQYVVLTDEELEAYKPKAAHTIEIEEFVDLAAIDPLYFEQPYYLAPDPKALKPYRLLVEAMAEQGKVAVGRIVLRSKERLVAIRPLDGVLCLETMRHADEVLPHDALLPDEDVELTARERAMAAQLVESLAVDRFEPERFPDEYRTQLLELIEAKAAGEEVVTQPEAEAPAKVLDLVAALEASIAAAGGQGDGRGAGEAAADETADEAAGEGRPAPRRAGPATRAAKAKKAAKAAKAPEKKQARSKRSA